MYHQLNFSFGNQKFSGYYQSLPETFCKLRDQVNLAFYPKSPHLCFVIFPEGRMEYPLTRDEYELDVASVSTSEPVTRNYVIKYLPKDPNFNFYRQVHKFNFVLDSKVETRYYYNDSLPSNVAKLTEHAKCVFPSLIGQEIYMVYELNPLVDSVYVPDITYARQTLDRTYVINRVDSSSECMCKTNARDKNHNISPTREIEHFNSIMNFNNQILMLACCASLVFLCFNKH